MKQTMKFETLLKRCEALGFKHTITVPNVTLLDMMCSYVYLTYDVYAESHMQSVRLVKDKMTRDNMFKPHIIVNCSEREYCTDFSFEKFYANPYDAKFEALKEATNFVRRNNVKPKLVDMKQYKRIELRPSDFARIDPYESVFRQAEYKTVAQNIMICLKRTGDTFRKLTLEEYITERNYAKSPYHSSEAYYFNYVIDYCISADKAKTFSRAWDIPKINRK